MTENPKSPIEQAREEWESSQEVQAVAFKAYMQAPIDDLETEFQAYRRACEQNKQKREAYIALRKEARP